MWNAEFLSAHELAGLGFGAIGADVLIHRTCVLVNCTAIRIGDNVRIDPFCVITARESLCIGSNVHIGSHCLLAGGAGIAIEDFAGVSHGTKIFSESDDYREAGLIGPTIPAEFRRVKAAPVRLATYCVIGASGVVLPGADVGEGASVGALSLVKGALDPWTIYAGAPARAVGRRDKDGVLAMAAAFQARAAD